jgi:hypothetical protein
MRSFRLEHADIGREEGAIVPVVPLPSNPNVDRLRATAKDLRDLVRAGVEGAVATVREHHPRLGSLRAGSPEALGFKLADAQLTLARHHGLASWPKLVAHVEAVRALSRSPHERLGNGAARDGDELVRLACLNFGADSPARAAAAMALWRADPALATSSVFAAAASGDHATVARLVARDPVAASAPGGPFDWPPLLYVTYSRLVTTDPAHDAVETARVLLRAGADPNAGFFWDGLVPPFTAITGVVGRGEQGAAPHARQLELLALLLDAGADPNDGQLVYDAGIGNARPADDTDWLELLLAHGLGGAAHGPWYRRFGDRLPAPAALVTELLHDAARRGFVRRARLLLDHGADPSRGGDHPVSAGRTPYDDAVARGYPEVAAMLAQAGAQAGSVGVTDVVAGRLLAGDAVTPAEVDAARAHAPDLVRTAAELRKPVAVLRHLVELGWDVNAKRRTTALHEAAMLGDLGLVQALVALGADPTIRDDSFDATPAGWADHFGHAEIGRYLDGLTPPSSAARADG